MRILLTNDDGIDAPGLLALEEALSRDNEVYVVAPKANQSGSSSSIHLFSSMSLEKRDERHWALGGSPVHCGRAPGKGSFAPSSYDLIISGINKGSNIGTDIVYSGTCGAARQAAVYSLPGVALSVDAPADGEAESYDYGSLASFVAPRLEAFVSLCTPESREYHAFPYFVNVNAPHRGPYRGVSFTSVSHREYMDKFRFADEDKKSVMCVGGGLIRSLGGEDCDSAAVSRGDISISLVYAQSVSADLSSAGKDGLSPLFSLKGV